ncbi:fatty acid desaturase [Amycolatopsis anabasis]|uniref:fatty acid desaturase n=1 Tax=Amycolatopsis anabasis TaxID=1840409 RepID=UPI00131BAD8A|nr:fatty acid desaturase [Amycolatopsis anabasis]
MSVIDAPSPHAFSPGRTTGRRVPNPRIPLRNVSAPTAMLFAAGLAVWGTATWLGLTGGIPLWGTIVANALVTFTMFTVLHESVHHSAGRFTWVNELLGRLSMLFVAVYGSFPLMRFLHLEHHRNTNADPRTDPDAWSSHGPAWQLPFRWLTVDAWYARCYLARTGTRPPAEVAETTAVALLALGGFTALIATGYGWELLVVYLIPQRIGLVLLAWWFDWLPHHHLPASRDRFGVARVRVGLEWLMTPLMLSQNYHLVHHLHPAVPFYRYRTAWRVNRETYLARNVPITTAWGRDLSADEYRAWRRLGEPCAERKTVTAAEPVRRREFHRLAVAAIDPLTEEAVAVTFAVPAGLRETFRFVPGQHVTIRSTVDEREVRRNYSICSPAPADTLRIAVKRRDCGRFSIHANTCLRPGDTLEVRPPSGRFVLAPEPGRTRHYVGLAAGIGITPILSMLTGALTVEAQSRFTLLYVNRCGASTMFADELTALARRFEGRLTVLHYRTDERDPDLHPPRTSRPLDTIAEALAISFEEHHRGRLDARRFHALLGSRLHPAKVDDWFLCGPPPLVDAARDLLLEHDVPDESVHCELFCAEGYGEDG